MSHVAGSLSYLIFGAFSLAALVLWVQLLFLFPLTIAYEVWKKKALRRLASHPFRKRVSIIVPAYNEEKTLRATLLSLLKSDYPDFELIVVNDGSTDDTESTIDDLIRDQKVTYILQENGGKANALNRGIAASTGEIILYTDADSIFLPDTIGLMVRWFGDSSIDAVCGNDTPLRAKTPLQKVLAVTSHIGTGFVRRALSVTGVLPIITGNLGAVRKGVLAEIGGFHPVWGEDLDLTFRLHQGGKRIVFDPAPIIRSDCPAGLNSLWRQRIRWVRSYLKISRIHAGLFRPRQAIPFSLYLPLNYFTQIIVPILQILAVALLLNMIRIGGNTFYWWLGLLIFLGLFSFLAVALYSIILDRDWKTMIYLPLAFFLIVPLSYFYNLIVAVSIWKEVKGKKEIWQKIERTPTGAGGQWGGVGLLISGGLLLVLFILFKPSLSNQAVEKSFVAASKGYFYPASKGEMALATHFDPWNNWKEGISSVLRNQSSYGMKLIGIGAGRAEWTYFRWNPYPENWSSNQKNEKVDLLGEAVSSFNEHHFKTVAIIDLYAPALIQKNPKIAAVRFDGERSTEQVSFTELVDGEYGQKVVEMAEYLARNYPLKAIALTEISYRSFCFDDRCLLSYRKRSGRPNWPRDKGGAVNRDDPSIWEWRSEKMEKFISRIAKAVHQEGKELYVDVPVSWNDFSRHGKDSGLDYARILRHADRIVVWNYFYLENLKPDISFALAKDLSSHFPPEKVMVSIGLWGNSKPVAPEEFKIALDSTLKGGIPNIWITPNHLMSPPHWKALTDTLGISSPFK